MPWIDPELESYRITDNLRRVTAMMKKVHDVVFKEDMPMVNKAHMHMDEQGFVEEVPRNNFIRLGGLTTSPVLIRHVSI